ncbi:ATP-binding protein [Streptomyces sp. HC307]|uniref:ATP-binding protein n=1 Tax=Streptomyces flavusporus TaxID=3385496 RepID=UPI0039171804
MGLAPSCAVSESAALVVAELAANAVAHGRVKGRGFRVSLAVEAPDTLRIEVADPRGDRRPVSCHTASAIDETGRGLLLVDALTARWGSQPWPPSGKVVWAEIALPCPVIAPPVTFFVAPQWGAWPPGPVWLCAPCRTDDLGGVAAGLRGTA